MPAMHFNTCPNGDVIRGVPFKIIALDAKGHGEDCPLTNHHRHGRLRWFFASIRCYCECHVPQVYIIEEIPDLPVASRDMRVTRRNMRVTRR